MYIFKQLLQGELEGTTGINQHIFFFNSWYKQAQEGKKKGSGPHSYYTCKRKREKWNRRGSFQPDTSSANNAFGYLGPPSVATSNFIFKPY